MSLSLSSSAGKPKKYWSQSRLAKTWSWTCLEQIFRIKCCDVLPHVKRHPFFSHMKYTFLFILECVGAMGPSFKQHLKFIFPLPYYEVSQFFSGLESVLNGFDHSLILTKTNPNPTPTTTRQGNNFLSS